MPDIGNEGSSRLSISGEQFRSQLIPRNLYNLDNEYKSTDKLSLRNKNKVADSIASILSVIPQYQHFNPENSLISRAFSNTPLTEIGTVMLAQQMFYNSASHIAQQNLPTVNLSNVLKGKSPFSMNVNQTITINNQDNKTLLDKVGGFIGKTLFNTDAVGNNYPFHPSLSSSGIIGSTNIDYIINTGKGQLTHFYDSINLNIYKQIGSDDSSDTIIQYGTKIGNEIQQRVNITSKKKYFNFSDKNAYPYLYKPSDTFTINSEIYANNDESTSYSFITKLNTIQEYAPTQQFIDDNFGTTNKSVIKEYVENFVSDKSDITTDDIKDKLVWGRDGVSSNTQSYLASQHGDTDNEINNLKSTNTTEFKINGGLLEYTRNLLNASNGYLVDITRKVFTEGTKIIGFNGSPLWQAPNEVNSAYAAANNISNKNGVRQHTMIDQYDRFAKAIRFNGNKVYEGNPNSVIYKTVIPQIHPELDTNNQGKLFLNPKNMMFSIENLAVHAIKQEGYGEIDGETMIPLSEVGPFNGRIMWFPPYDLQLNETTNAKYESTVMVGRNEPMYNYMNSERTAQINFTLLVDYPEQLRNFISSNENQNKNIADFFAFGGNPLLPEKQIENLELKLKQLQDSITKENGPIKQAEPSTIKPSSIQIFFPNNMPTEDEVDIVIEKMYNNPLHYEIKDGCLSAEDGNGFGLNFNVQGIYDVVGLSADTTNTHFILTGNSIQQYRVSNLNNELNRILYNTYNNPDNRKYYDIIIDGGSSKLYQGKDEVTYNKALGDRRIAAAKKLVEERLKAIFNVNDVTNDLGIKITSISSSGSAGSSAVGATISGMAFENVKRERQATIKIQRNDKTVEPKNQTLNKNQQQNIQKIKDDIAATELLLNKTIKEYSFQTREKAILNGFESISKNNYYPVFHTQTPEDFHRRLTFLQQCTRQGSSKQSNSEVDVTGTLRAKNSVFGRQPICILRVGDFFYTKVIIENVTVDYNETTWDMNPEGFGMQPMLAKITLQMKLIGGQSLEGPIDALQNAATFNYYANSTFRNTGIYANPSKASSDQTSYKNGITTNISAPASPSAINNTLQKQNK